MSIEISKRLAAVNAASAVAVKLLNVTVLVWMNQYIYNHISKDELAIYPVIMSVMVFTPIFTEFMTSGVGRYIVEAVALRDERRVVQIVSSITPILFIWGIGMTIGGWMLAMHVESFLTIDPAHVGDAHLMMGLLVTSAALQMMALPFTVGFDIRQRYVLLNSLQLVRELLRMGLLLFLLVFVNARVLWIVVSSVTAILLYQFVMVAISMRLTPFLRVRLKEFSWKTAHGLLGFGLWTTLGQMANMIQNTTGVLVLNKFGSALDVNIYQLGNTFHTNIYGTTALATTPLQTAMTAMHATGDKRRLAMVYCRGGRLALWISMFVAVPLAVYSHVFIGLYVKAIYLPAAWVIILMMVLYPFTLSSAMLYKIVIAKAAIRVFYVGTFLTQLANLGLVVYVVSDLKMGAIGAAAATAIVTVLSEAFIFWPLGLHLAEVSLARFWKETIYPGLKPAAVTTVACLACLAAIRPEGWISLIACSTIAALVYVAAMLTWALQDEDRADLRTVIARFKTRMSGLPAAPAAPQAGD